jgi:hypothetical protein
MNHVTALTLPLAPGALGAFAVVLLMEVTVPIVVDLLASARALAGFDVNLSFSAARAFSNVAINSFLFLVLSRYCCIPIARIT